MRFGRAKEQGLRCAGSRFGRLALAELWRLPAGGRDHQRHAVDFTFTLQGIHIAHAISVKFGLIGEEEQVDDNAGGIKDEALLNRAVDDFGVKCARQRGAVDIGNIGAQNQSGAVLAGDGLQDFRGAGVAVGWRQGRLRRRFGWILPCFRCRLGRGPR